MTSQTSKQTLLLLVAAIGFSSCNKVDFSELPQETQLAQETPPAQPEPPVEPPPVKPPPENPPPVIVQPGYKLSAGNCAADSSTQLLSCTKCNVPLNPPAPPQLSKKGQALVDSLVLACGVKNASDPAGYKAPTREQLMARLNRASPTLYPDTTMTKAQVDVIKGLTDVNDATMRNKMFGGLWYQPPYSDAFETYFGIEVGEARYTFCYNAKDAKFGPNETSVMMSKQYIDCTYQGNGFCNESPAYVSANSYRKQLRTVMQQSVSNPYVAPAPTPSKSCQWEKFEGDDMNVAKQKVKDWTQAGFSISMSIDKGSGVGYCGAVLPESLSDKTVSIAAYLCQ